MFKSVRDWNFFQRRDFKLMIFEVEFFLIELSKIIVKLKLK